MFNISIFLVCSPGRGVTNPAFTGSVAELDSEFVTHVRLLYSDDCSGVIVVAVGLPEFL